jgi:adenosylmethionine-8-amino-7-oxononanoate aminotransferase
VRPPSRSYWEGVNDLCREHGILLIADEVVTGFGRLGHWFGSDRYGIEADMITTAKGITSGYMPLGAVIAGKRIRDVMWSEQAGGFRHGYTYSGHPTACAVAMENLDIVERERLTERVADLEAVFEGKLAPLGRHSAVSEVRTAGLLAGVEISSEAREGHPGLVDEVAVLARERGVLTRSLIGKTIQISPPFVIDDAQIEEIVEVITDSLNTALALPTAGAEHL